MKSFTLDGFAKELGNIKSRVPAMMFIAAESIGGAVELTAKAEIGEYQRSDMGGFEPWAELKDATKKDRIKKGFTENDPGLRTGQMRDSIEHEVNGMNVAIGSNDDKLLWFEHGTVKQAPRSVIGLAAHRAEHEIDAINRLTVERIFK